MNKLFNIDSPIMMGLSRMTEMVLLSVLWFACCLPIITIGPSTTALYYVSMKLERNEDVKIVPTFFRAFKENFKQAVALNLIFLVVITILFLDYFYMSGVDGTYGTISSVCFFVMGIWTLCSMFYAYPLQAQFFNTVRQTLINAALLSMRKIVTTIIVFILNMLPVIVAFLSFEVFVRTAPIWVLLAPGLIAAICSKLFVRLFDPFLKAAQGMPGKDDGKEEE